MGGRESAGTATSSRGRLRRICFLSKSDIMLKRLGKTISDLVLALAAPTRKEYK